jgi:hypothetical protein
VPLGDSVSLTGSARRRTAALAMTALSLLASGCATWGWYREETSVSQFNQDRYGCLSASRIPIPPPSPITPGPSYGVAGGYAAGYSATMSAYGATAAAMRQQEELFAACLEARGYQWRQQTDVLGRRIAR